MRKPRPRDLHASERQETSHCFTSAVKPIPGDHHNRPSLTFLDLWQSNEFIRKGLLNLRGGIKKTIPKNLKILRFFFTILDQKLVFIYHFWPKTEFFLPFFSLRGGEGSCPIQKILIRKNWGGQKRGRPGVSVFLTESKKNSLFMAPLMSK